MNPVLDASATVAWALEEENTRALHFIFEQVERDGAWVPSLWRLEVANVLEVKVRKGRQTAAFRDGTLCALAALPIEIDALTDVQAWSATLGLAIKHRLPVYDAAYLELALRLALPLATLDDALGNAARSENVPVIGI